MLPKYNDAQTQVDQILSQYYQANNIKKDGLDFDLIRKFIIAQQRTKDFIEVISKMTALLTY
jgi:hypothetical protein